MRAGDDTTRRRRVRGAQRERRARRGRHGAWVSGNGLGDFDARYCASCASPRRSSFEDLPPASNEKRGTRIQLVLTKNAYVKKGKRNDRKKRSLCSPLKSSSEMRWAHTPQRKAPRDPPDVRGCPVATFRVHGTARRRITSQALYARTAHGQTDAHALREPESAPPP